MKMLGIDISLWQRGIDLIAAKQEGVEFVIIKASEGRFADPCFEEHYDKARAAGLHIGAYHYLTAKDAEEAKNEADFFGGLLRSKLFDMPVYLDIESPDLTKNAPSFNTEIALSFLRRSEENGFFTGIYTYSSFLRYNLIDARLQKYAHWIAEIAKEKPKYKGNGGVFGIWQFGGGKNLLRTNKVAGTVCDQNYCYIDYPDAVKRKKLNGFGGEVIPQPTDGKLEVGALVTVSPDAAYSNGIKVPPVVTRQRWFISKITGDVAVIDKNESGNMSIRSAVEVKYLKKV